MTRNPFRMLVVILWQAKKGSGVSVDIFLDILWCFCSRHSDPHNYTHLLLNLFWHFAFALVKGWLMKLNDLHLICLGYKWLFVRHCIGYTCSQLEWKDVKSYWTSQIPTPPFQDTTQVQHLDLKFWEYLLSTLGVMCSIAYVALSVDELQ